MQQYESPGACYGATGSFRPPVTNIGGTVPQLQKGSFLRGYRRRLNVYPLLLCLVVPWALFSTLYLVMSFEIHYNSPFLCTLVAAGSFVAIAIVGAYAISTRVKTFANPEHEPTWLFFLALSMLLAWVLALAMGNENYLTNMRPFYDMHNLNEYVDVSPQAMRGQQLMDAGIIKFVNGTKLDISRSMGFKSDIVYCIAPITLGTEKLPSYDFWAVGTDCCSGAQADFHCTGWNSPGANGALRLMADQSRAFYRLAVQQAEAAYKIKAFHPLFFSWVPDAHGTVESWQSDGRTNCIIWIVSHFVLQCFLVVVATLVLAKLGHD